jgi:hypothetical protein
MFLAVGGKVGRGSSNTLLYYLCISYYLSHIYYLLVVSLLPMDLFLLPLSRPSDGQRRTVTEIRVAIYTSINDSLYLPYIYICIYIYTNRFSVYVYVVGPCMSLNNYALTSAHMYITQQLCNDLCKNTHSEAIAYWLMRQEASPQTSIVRSFNIGCLHLKMKTYEFHSIRNIVSVSRRIFSGQTVLFVYMLLT